MLVSKDKTILVGYRFRSITGYKSKFLYESISKNINWFYQEFQIILNVFYIHENKDKTLLLVSGTARFMVKIQIPSYT